ncbi:MAG: hypothetical protein ABL996_14050 [Micropepsaceae bacterium]
MNDLILFWIPIGIAFCFAGVAVMRLIAAYRSRLARISFEKKESRSYREALRDYSNAKSKLESRGTGVTIVDLIHDLSDQEKIRDNASHYIDYESTIEILNRIRNSKPSDEIEIVIHTLGGYTLPAEMIAAALKAHKGTTTAYVPYIAMSGGTMIALATDKIVLGKNAALGPIDSQLWGFPLENYAKLRSEKSIDKIDDTTLLVAYEAEKYHAKANDRACAILAQSHKDKAKRYSKNPCHAVDELMSAKLPHGQRIDYKHADEIHLVVEDGIKKKEVYELFGARLRMIRASVEEKKIRNGENEGAESGTDKK